MSAKIRKKWKSPKHYPLFLRRAVPFPSSAGQPMRENPARMASILVFVFMSNCANRAETKRGADCCSQLLVSWSGAHGGTPLQLTPNSNLSYGDLSCDLHFLLHYLRQFDGEHSVGHMCCDFLFVDVVRQYQRLLELGV